MNTYVIALIEEGENQLEFYSTLMFRQGSVIDDGIFAVGLASGYDDALYLVEEIAKEVYEKTVPIYQWTFPFPGMSIFSTFLL